MQDTRNPYASPMATEMSAVAAQWLQSPSTSLTKVANGLGLIYAGIVVVLLSAIGGPILVAVIAAATHSAGLVMILGVLLVVGVLAGVVLNIVGNIFCLATPEETGAQGLIYASVGAMGLGLLISLASLVVTLPQGISLLQMLLNLVAGITFMLFLHRLALFIGRQDLAAKAKSILTWCIICAALFVAAMVIMIGSLGMAFFQAANGGAMNRADVANVGAGAGLGGLLMVVVLIVGLITFVRYANLLTYMRKAILSGGRG
jgi:hypothetical protein